MRSTKTKLFLMVLLMPFESTRAQAQKAETGRFSVAGGGGVKLFACEHIGVDASAGLILAF